MFLYLMWQETSILSIKIMKGIKEVERLKADINNPDWLKTGGSFSKPNSEF